MSLHGCNMEATKSQQFYEREQKLLLRLQKKLQSKSELSFELALGL